MGFKLKLTIVFVHALVFYTDDYPCTDASAISSIANNLARVSSRFEFQTGHQTKPSLFSYFLQQIPNRLQNSDLCSTSPNFYPLLRILTY